MAEKHVIKVKNNRFDLTLRALEENLRRLCDCGLIERDFKQIGEIREDILKALTRDELLQIKSADYSTQLKLAKEKPFYRIKKTINRDIKDIEELLHIRILNGSKDKQYKFPDIKNSNPNQYKKIVRMFVQMIYHYFLLENSDFDLSINTIIKNVEFPLEILAKLFIAIKGKKCIRINYYNEYREQMRINEIHPYSITMRGGRWLLIGYKPSVSDYRQYHIYDIQSVEFKKDGEYNFIKKADFSLKSFYAHAMPIFHNRAATLSYKIWFSRKAVALVERTVFNPTAQIEKNQDGSAFVYFTADGVEEVIHWVLSFGADAKMVEPKNIACMIKKRLKTMLKNY